METTRYKVLLIEDDKIAQMAFRRLVRDEHLPYDYTIASSVSEANTILRTNRFDILIVDYLLGDGTAFDILDSITNTPTIFATGAGNEELAVKAMKAGAYDYLIKDSTHNYLKVLPEIIKNAIRHKKVADEVKKYHDNLEQLVKERTEQLAREKELLSVTLSSMGDAVIAVDAEKRITLFNQVAQNLTGYKLDDVEGKPIHDVLSVINEHIKQPVDNPINQVLESGRIETGSAHDALISRDGSEHPISATAAPIRKNDGTVIGAVMVLRDVAKQRELDRMKTDFVSSVSHELRTPLTAIKAYTATILRDPDMAEQTKREFLAIIDEESTRLTNLVEDILEISQIESGTVKVPLQAVGIAAVVEQVLSALKPLADKKNIQLQTNIDAELPKLQADETKIQSMVTNLVHNAIKFTPHNGAVSILVRRRDEQLVMRVSDTGMGIPKEDLPKIFDRFYRVYTPGMQIQGTGLGLAIVRKISMMHGGTIEVQSKVGRGTTFTILLPLTAQPALEATIVN